MCGGPTVHTITITATNENPSPPTLTDEKGLTSTTAEGDKNFTTQVANGQVVKWVKAGNITEINAITQDGGTNVFSTLPTKQSDGSWSGVVGNLPSDTSESYLIQYTVNGTLYTQDPRLKMN